MEQLEDFIVCHCVSKDCTDCPMRNTGTGSLKTIYDNYKIRKELENANQDIDQRKEIQQEVLR